MEKLEFKEIKRLLNICYQCGTCVSSCAAGLVNPQKNIRKLVQNLIDAEDEFAIKKNDLLWLCTTCYQCEDRCPEGIPLTSLLIQLKNMAANRGLIPASIQKEVEAIATHNFTYPLPELPRPDEAEMQTLMTLIRSHDEAADSGGLTN